MFTLNPHRFLASLALLLAVCVADAGVDSQAKAIVRSGELRSTKVSLYALDLETGENLLSLHSDEPMLPASNLKLVTSAAALSLLGADYHFKTELRLLSAAPLPATPGLPSLAIIGEGDPAFCDNTLLASLAPEVNDLDKIIALWVEHVKKTGVRHFERLLVDDRVFDRQFVHPSWPKDQLTAWYCAQVAGINFNTNCIDVYPEPQTPGAAPRVRIYPHASFITTINRAVTGSADTFWVHRAEGSNDLTFMGKIKSRRASAINVTLHDPPIFFAQLLAQRLAEAGIRINGIQRPEDQTRLPPGQTLHIVQTGMRPILARCNKDSQNLYAEALLKRIGQRLTGSPGSWENGSAAARVFLNQKLGPTAAVVRLADGSGLSRDNRVTAHALVELLRVMAADPANGSLYMQSLSVAGEDGTLDNRLEAKLAGQVFAKSGYIAGVSCLSGYLALPKPQGGLRTIAFSFLFNDLDPKVSVHQVKGLQDKLVRLLDGDLAKQLDSTRLGG